MTDRLLQIKEILRAYYVKDEHPYYPQELIIITEEEFDSVCEQLFDVAEQVDECDVTIFGETTNNPIRTMKMCRECTYSFMTNEDNLFPVSVEPYNFCPYCGRKLKNDKRNRITQQILKLLEVQ